MRVATDVLANEGMSALSIEDVAARAGVGKATIYRRWSSKGTLALDAFLAVFIESRLHELPDTGSLRSDLQISFGAWATAATTTSQGRMLVDLIAEAQRDPELAAGWRDRVVRPIRASYAAMMERAKARGEIAEDADADLALDLLFGGGLYRLLHGHKPVNDEFVDRAVSMVMTSLGVPSALDPARSYQPARPGVSAGALTVPG